MDAITIPGPILYQFKQINDVTYDNSGDHDDV